MKAPRPLGHDAPEELVEKPVRSIGGVAVTAVPEANLGVSMSELLARQGLLGTDKPSLAPIANSQTQDRPKTQQEPEAKIELIDINQIDDPVLPPRWHYSEQQIFAMAQSILTQGNGDALKGQLQPVIVMPSADGRYVMIEGLTRLKAFRQHNLGPKIKAIVAEPMPPLEAFTLGYRANEHRNTLTDYDYGMSFSHALTSGEAKSVQHLADSLKISSKIVYAMLSFAKLPESTHKIIEESKSSFSYNVAASLASLRSKLNDDDEVSKAAKKILDGTWTGERLAKHVASLAGTRPPRNSRTGTTTTIQGLGKMRYDSKKMSVELDLSKLPSNQSEEIAQKIKQVLKEYEVPELPPEDPQGAE